MILDFLTSHLRLTLIHPPNGEGGALYIKCTLAGMSGPPGIPVRLKMLLQVYPSQYWSKFKISSNDAGEHKILAIFALKTINFCRVTITAYLSLGCI